MSSNETTVFSPEPLLVEEALQALQHTIGQALDDVSVLVLRESLSKVRAKSVLSAEKLLSDATVTQHFLRKTLATPSPELRCALAAELDKTYSTLSLSLAAVLNASAFRLKQPHSKAWLNITSWQHAHRASFSRHRAEAVEQRQALERMLSSAMGMMREVLTVPPLDRLLALNERFPNFGPVTTYIAEQLAFQAELQRRKPETFEINPVLLVGAPGIGKTEYLRQLPPALGLDVAMWDMGSCSAGFQFSGLAPGWGNATPGQVLERLSCNKYASFVGVLDELDKVGDTEGKSPPMNPLLQLLEPGSSRSFHDEFYGFSVNASSIFWLATANNLQAINTPLLNRFKVFEIEKPDIEQTRQIARTMYSDCVQDTASFPEQIPMPWLNRIQTCSSVRDLRQRMVSAMGKALLRSQIEKTDLQLLEVDIDSPTSPKNKLGFY